MKYNYKYPLHCMVGCWAHLVSCWCILVTSVCWALFFQEDDDPMENRPHILLDAYIYNQVNKLYSFCNFLELLNKNI